MNLLDECALAAWARANHTSIVVAACLFEMVDGDDEAARIWTAPTDEEKEELARRIEASTMTLRRAAEIAAQCEDEDLALGTMIAFSDIADGGAWGYDFIEGLRVSGETSWAELTVKERADELEQSVACEIESQIWHEIGAPERGNQNEIAKAAGYRMSEARKLYDR